MRISSRGEYGVRALFELALCYGRGPVPLKLIAERQDISEHYLEQLMGTLRKDGLVVSVRGAQGGYELARPPASVRVGDVIRALEGPVGIADETAKVQPDELGKLALRHMWRRLAGSLNEVLDGVTLADLVQELERLRAEGGALMYHI